MSLVGEWDIIGTTRENSSIYNGARVNKSKWECCFCEYKSLIEQHFFICNKLNRYGILMFKVMCSGYIWEE